MAQTLYRVVRSFPPSVDDFLSNQAKGLPPRGPEVSMPELHSGISMFHTVAGAQGAARRMRSPGLICEVAFPEGAPVRMRPTLGYEHYTVWGDAATLAPRFKESSQHRV